MHTCLCCTITIAAAVLVRGNMLYLCVGTVDSISLEFCSLLSTIQFLVTYSTQNGEEGLGAHTNEVKRQRGGEVD